MGKNVNIELLEKINNSKSEEDLKVDFLSLFRSFKDWKISFHSEGSGKPDALVETSKGNILLEFKKDRDLRDRYRRSEVIVQSLFDLKKEEIPIGVVGGISNWNLYYFPARVLEKYLSRTGIDWCTASSKAPNVYKELVDEISEDVEVQNFITIRDLDESFDYQEMKKEIEETLRNKPYITPVTEKNVLRKYKFFDEKVLMSDRQPGARWIVYIEGSGGKSVKSPDLFFTLLTQPDECFLHPEKEGIAIIGNYRVRVNPTTFGELKRAAKNIDPEEMDKMVANKDRLLEEIYRRYTGAYFTPKIWVDEAHKMITEALGKNWKEEYVVWDCAAGTANLTQGYPFKELYISTLEQGDIDIIKARNYNQGATIFRYDFLSEIYSKGSILDGTGIDKVPFSLKQAFESGKKILFLINPPYGTAGTYRTTRRLLSKPGVAKNTVNREMLREKVGWSSGQLYIQFMYKILSLKKVFPQTQISVALFVPPKFLTASSYGKFRSRWKSSFAFLYGMLFSAKHFSDISSDNWGVSFTVWGDEKEFLEASEEVLILKDINSDTGEVENIGSKELYSAKSDSLSKWIREEVRGDVMENVPHLSSALKVRQEGRGRIVPGALGYILDASANQVRDTARGVALFSSPYVFGGGTSILSSNFRKVVALFVAKKIIKNTWMNYLDEYLTPNTSHSDYERWVDDAIVYSLFHTESQQSSLRKVNYKGKKWNIKNQFFFLSNEEMRELANKYLFNEMYQDAKTSEDRYVYKLLQTTLLSEDAQEVLIRALELVRKSMKVRKEYHNLHPERHLQAWDAGWAQLKPMLKEHFKEEFEQFKALYKQFENRMREGVYKFGFLRR